MKIKLLFLFATVALAGCVTRAPQKPNPEQVLIPPGMDRMPIASGKVSEPLVPPKGWTNVFHVNPPRVANPWRWYIRWVASNDLILWSDVAPYDQYSTNIPTIHSGQKPFAFYTIAATLTKP